MKNLLVLTLSLTYSFGSWAQVPGVLFSIGQGIDCDPSSVIEKNCFSEYDLNKNPSTNEERIERDKRVCSCLFAQQILYVDENNELIYNNPEDEYRSENLVPQGSDAAVDFFQERIQSEFKQYTVGMEYTAQFLKLNGGPDVDQSSTFSLQSFFNHPLATSLKNQVQGKLTSIASLRGEFDDGIKKRIEVISNLAPSETSGEDRRRTVDRWMNDLGDGATSQTYQVNKDPTKLPANACVTGEEFIKFNQLPQENEFYEYLSKTNEFREADWNYDSLVREYDSVNNKGTKTQSDEKKLKELRARLSFLKKNPLMKGMFSASMDNLTSTLDKLNFPDDVKKSFIEKFKGSDFLPKKVELFRHLKELTPRNNSCFMNRGESCLYDATKRIVGGIDKYTRDLQNFFNKEQNAIQAGALQSFNSDLNRIFENPSSSTLPLTYKHLQNTFSFKYGRSISQCQRSKGNEPVCNGVFEGQYCPMLRQVVMQKNKNYKSIEDELYQETLNFWTPDLELNAAYNDFNNKVCHTKKRASDRPGSPALTFFEFKEQYCGIPANRSDCQDSPGKMRKLVETYHKQYQFVDQSGNPKKDEMLAQAFVKGSQQFVNTASPYKARESNDIFKEVFSTDDEKFSKPSLPATVSTNLSQPNTHFSNALENMNNSLSANIPDSGSQYLPQGNSSSVTPNSAKIDPQNLTDEDKTKIDSAAEAELAAVKKELARAQESASRAGLEARMKMLEELLAQKDKSAAQYEKLIQQLSSRLDNPSSTVANSGVAQPEMLNNRSKGNTYTATEQSVDDKSYRAPASINENPAYTTAGTSAGAASVSGSSGTQALRSGRGSSSFNSALLEAQESKSGKIQRSSDGSIILASDVNSPVLEALGSAANPSSDYSLSVPVADYAGFEAQNMETLKRYQEKFLTSMESNQPVRVFVRAENRNPLEFYVVKDGNKLFFKPVRKTGATLEALKQTVKKIP